MTYRTIFSLHKLVQLDENWPKGYAWGFREIISPDKEEFHIFAFQKDVLILK